MRERPAGETGEAPPGAIVGTASTTGARWLDVRVRPRRSRDAVADALFAAGSTGVQETGDELRTHFPEGADADFVRGIVLAADPGAEFHAEWAPAVDWSEAWKQGVHAHDVGALTVAPPWLAGEHDPARTIVIDPGMAFGTGEHATTRGVIRLAASLIRHGDRVADLGTGSAVLAIAAVKLGAAWAAAIEIDAEAIANAEENVRRNGVADRVTVLHGDAAMLLALVAPVQVVLANIISSVLIGLLPAIDAALVPGGGAILSGILAEERPRVLEILGRGGWIVVADDVEDEWWSVAIARP